jgi:hypothetical protein
VASTIKLPMRVKQFIRYLKSKLSEIRKHNPLNSSRQRNAEIPNSGHKAAQAGFRQDDPFFFIHIPKTAGTSFRVAAENSFGLQTIEKNYGPKSVQTTSLTRKYLIEQSDIFGFHQQLKCSNTRMYTGHVNAIPMAYVLPMTRIVTFLRKPADQVISHYNHSVRWHGSKKTIEEFCRVPHFRDLQATRLRHIPIQLMGIIGLTENYENSLEMFNQTYGTELPLLIENVNDDKKIDVPDNAILALIRKMNTADVALYDIAQRLFYQRFEIYKQNLPWCHGAIQEQNDTHLAGYACWAHSDEPVELVLSSNGQDIAESRAIHPKPFLSRFVLPRRGIIGFAFTISDLKDRENIEVRVKSTGQKLEKQFIPEPLS